MRARARLRAPRATDGEPTALTSLPLLAARRARRPPAAQNMLVPSVSLNSDGSLNRWGVGWMSRLNNGDALAARLDADNKLDVRYDRQCDDGSQWRLNANVPSLGGSDVISNTEWSVTRAWSK